MSYIAGTRSNASRKGLLVKESTGAGRRLASAHVALAATVALLVLAQAVIAGRSDRLFGTWSITLHGVIGNVVFVVVLADLVVLAIGRASRAALVTTSLLTLVVVAQIGLGYAGRERLGAAAWHVPNGVAAFGLAVWSLSLALRPRTVTA